MVFFENFLFFYKFTLTPEVKKIGALLLTKFSLLSTKGEDTESLEYVRASAHGCGMGGVLGLGHRTAAAARPADRLVGLCYGAAPRRPGGLRASWPG